MTYSELVTNDGSITYYSERYREAMHSRSGAEEEAKKKYALALRLDTFPSVSILDVGFGLGYNTAAAIDLCTSTITVAALEQDVAVFDLIHQIRPSFKSYPLIQQLTPKSLHVENDNASIHLFLGNAVKTISQLPGQFLVCFLDPYSPTKNPELWTTQFLKQIYQKLLPGGKLATYSCAKHVRVNLAAAGFRVTDGPRVGRRGPSTIALKPKTS